MSDANYRQGLKILQLDTWTRSRFVKGALDHFSVVEEIIDLRTDPAFAWRVACALMRLKYQLLFIGADADDKGHGPPRWRCVAGTGMGVEACHSPEEALYAAVERVGRVG